MKTYPFSSYRYITPLMILLSVALVVALTLLGNYYVPMLWLNWIVAGALSWGVWHISSRFRLEGGSDVRAFAISWPTLTFSINFAYCYLPYDGFFYKCLVELLALLGLLILTIALWQQRQSVLTHLFLGLILGFTSALVPHVCLWIVFIPLWCYYMRCWSVRNALAAVTGLLLGIWMAYCGVFLILGNEAADTFFSVYYNLSPFTGTLIPFELSLKPYTLPTSGLGLWQYVFLGIVFLLELIYSVPGIIAAVGQTVRASSIVQYISMLSIVISILLFLDIHHLAVYICLLSFLLSLQLTVHQANSRSFAQEWWTLILILIGSSLCLLPIFFASLPS